jgi:hypothetical protein
MELAAGCPLGLGSQSRLGWNTDMSGGQGIIGDVMVCNYDRDVARAWSWCDEDWEARAWQNAEESMEARN